MSSDKKDPSAGRPGKVENRGSADFSIDDFIKEIEKAEDAQASKPLYAERMRNKRALDREEAREAEKQAARDKKSTRSPATGMALKAPRSKANSVERPTNLDGFAEAPQAGFHAPATMQSTPSG